MKFTCTNGTGWTDVYADGVKVGSASRTPVRQPAGNWVTYWTATVGDRVVAAKFGSKADAVAAVKNGATV